MPSPTSTTVPTVRDSALPSNPSIWAFRMLMISSDLIAMIFSLLAALRALPVQPATERIRSRIRESRPLTLPSTSRSPTRSVAPPTRLASTSYDICTARPAIVVASVSNRVRSAGLASRAVTTRAMVTPLRAFSASRVASAIAGIDARVRRRANMPTNV